MRFYNQVHQFYCGVDLHARSMYLCILDHQGNVVLHQDLPAEPATFLEAVTPFREGLVVACECLFCWYWFADLCVAEDIPFVLGHALYMKAISGAKSKDDRIDSRKIAQLLRGGNLPIAYAYPKGMRETRDLLRRRMYLVHKRAEVIAHLVNTNSQYNLPPLGKKLIYAKNRLELNIPARFADASVRHRGAKLNGDWSHFRGICIKAGKRCGNSIRLSRRSRKAVEWQPIQLTTSEHSGRKCITSYSWRCGARFLTVAERGRFRSYRLLVFPRSKVNSNLDHGPTRFAVRAHWFPRRI